MHKKTTIFTIILSIFFTSINATSPIPRSTPPLITIQSPSEHFASIKQQIDDLWTSFKADKEFRLFQPGKSDSVLKEEFGSILETRELMWTQPEFVRALNLIENDLVRAPGCAAFAYNNTVPYYNASTIFLNGRYHIAFEGPRSKDIPSFFRFIQTYHITHLVRLTDSYEGETKKCHPYWEGLARASLDGKTYLYLPVDADVYPVRAFDLAHWRDHQGIDPKELLTLVLQVRKELDETDGLLAVHCSAGVGRTGTFLAAIAIVDMMDRREEFSIEEIVYTLSLQRIHSVAKTEQYITLHRMAELYAKLKG